MRLTTTSDHSREATASRQIAAPVALAALSAALVLIFLLDRATGSAPVQHLYYLPIVFGAVRFGKRGALAVAVTTIILYHAANPHLLTFRYEEVDMIKIVLFVAVGSVAARLSSDNRRLHSLAMTDDLTGLHNLRSFEMQFIPLIRESREMNTPLSVLMLDLDKLKSLNDAYGHLTGAEAVRTVGHLLAEHLDEHDIACRYGGDEFVVALPKCPVERATDLGRDLCSAVQALEPRLADRRFPEGTLSISVGVAWIQGDSTEEGQTQVSDADWGQALFHAADSALYCAKESGRNRVSVEEHPVNRTPTRPHS